MIEKTKIAIVGSVGIPANYGGFETLVEYLVIELNREIDFTVFCSSQDYPIKHKEYAGATLKYVRLKANGIQSIPYDIISLIKVRKNIDTVLVLGVASGFFLPIYKIITRKKIILNVDGLEWKREKWGKFAKWFLRNSERVSVRVSDIIVADNPVIAEHIRKSYGREAETISYGGDHADRKELTPETIKIFPFLEGEYAFKVCRIEPENNIHIILEAFAECPNLPICIVGNWNNSEYGRELKNKYLRFEHLFLHDPIYDQEKLNELRSNCALYVHGHSAGGTNPSLVEAMYLGLSILCFDVEYNRQTTLNQAHYFSSASDLIDIIKDKKQLATLKPLGDRMRRIALVHYTWEKISKGYLKLFID